jgi:hypothetical protein
VRDVCDGEPARQIDAIWMYLSLGRAAPLPAGLVIDSGEHEIVPADRPRLVGVFFEGASPRTIAVGNPENVHYAFDVQGSRLVCAWRGRFLDASGTWVGRAGALERPPTDDRTDLPGGVPLALLSSENAAWPTAEDASALGYRVLGRGYDAERRPVFRYALDDVTIEETPRPVLRAGGAALVRDFVVVAPQPREGLWMRAAVGAEIVASEGAWVCDGEQVLVVHGSPEVRVRRSGGASELLVRVGGWAPGADGVRHEARFGVEVSW